MAYFVAKELHMRPMDILLNWTCEELLVAYGHYANNHSYEYIESVPKKEWAKKKITWLDRWAVLFVTPDQLEELNKDESELVDKQKNAESILNASQILFG